MRGKKSCNSILAMTVILIMAGYTFGNLFVRETIVILRAHGRSKLSTEQQKNATLLATSLDMYMCWYFNGETVKQIHQINPDAKCLLYRNVRAIYNYSAEWETALKNGWILKDLKGNLIHSTVYSGYYLADIGNSDYQLFVAEWIKKYIDLYGFDGVFTDNGLVSKVSEWMWGTTTNKPINPRTGSVYTDQEAVNAMISLHKTIKAKIGNKWNIANGIYYGERFWEVDRHENYIKMLNEAPLDGFTSEELFNLETSYHDEGKWKTSVDFVVWLQDNYLNHGKIFCANGKCATDQIPKDCTTEQMANFVFASLLLGVKSDRIHYLFLQGATLLPSVQRLYKLNLGTPTEDYHIIEGTHIYSRKFSNGLVLVNPTYDDYSLKLDKNYQTLDGNIVNAITVPAHTGVILENPILTLKCHTVDSKDNDVKTHIELWSQDHILSAKDTNESGWCTFELREIKNYTLKVTFQGSQVNKTTITLNQKVTIILLHCQVYDLTVAVKDENDKALSNAEVMIQRPDDAIIQTMRTDENGLATFRQLPIGSYKVTATYGEISSDQKIVLDEDKTLSIRIILPSYQIFLTTRSLVFIFLIIASLTIAYVTYRHFKIK